MIKSFWKFKILFFVLSCILLPYSFTPVPLSFAAANPNWGLANVQRKVAIQSGGAQAGGVTSTDLAVWSESWRSNITNGAADMTAVGDGTYEYKTQLARGATYNFILFVRTNGSPPNGLSANSDYFDTVVNSTNAVMVTSATPSNPTEPATQIARFNAVGKTYDGRRVLTVPRSLAAGSTLYVFCNFSGTPTVPSNFQAQPSGPNSIELSWGKPYGVWGSGGDSFAAADVIAGGFYQLRHSTGNPSGPYENLATVPGSTFNYTRNGLSSGVTYYYVICSSDAYQGKFGSVNIENNNSGFSASPVAAQPQSERPVRFKVENIDLEKVSGKYKNLVWLTPWNEDGRSYPRKIPGRIVSVYIPPGRD